MDCSSSSSTTAARESPISLLAFNQHPGVTPSIVASAPQESNPSDSSILNRSSIIKPVAHVASEREYASPITASSPREGISMKNSSEDLRELRRRRSDCARRARDTRIMREKTTQDRIKALEDENALLRQQNGTLHMEVVRLQQLLLYAAGVLAGFEQGFG